MKEENHAFLEFPSCSANEGFARAAAACFAAQLDPTLEEINDVKTAVSEAVTNAIVHAYPDTLGKIVLKLRILGTTFWKSWCGTGAWASQILNRPERPCLPPQPGALRHGLYHYGELYGHAAGCGLHRRRGLP